MFMNDRDGFVKKSAEGVTAYSSTKGTQTEAVRLDRLADVEVAPLDVLELAVVFGVVSGGDGG